MNLDAQRYPLTWPGGWTRTLPRHRQRPAFGTKREGGYKQQMTVASATDRLATQMDRLLGASHVILSTNVELRLDGLPYSNRTPPDDPGAALYFKHDARPRCLACDKWDRIADNITALAKHVEAIRGMDRWGVGTLEQAFGGYVALPPAAEEWWLILGVDADATPSQIEAAYKKLARTNHPDRGGSTNEMARVNQARVAAGEAQKGDI